jgi:hypothetical protein
LVHLVAVAAIILYRPHYWCVSSYGIYQFSVHTDNHPRCW